MQPPTSDPELNRDFSLIKILLNTQLKDILRNEFLPVSGVKTVLQTRIMNYLHQLSLAGDTSRLSHARQLVRSFFTTPSGSTSSSSLSTSQFPSRSTAAASTPPSRLLFKDSPFYTIIEELSPITQCEAREINRDSVDLKVTLNERNSQRLTENPNIRAYLFCAIDNGLAQYTRHDVTFPTQVEVKVNMDDLKTNFRGLRNRPGTVKPADITGLLRNRPGYPNRVHFVYALTRKKFYVLVNLVRQRSVSELALDLRTRSTLPAEQVIREFKKKAEDSDIITTSVVLSLKCPLSTLRMSTPCRSSVCTHNQCYDVTSYLELQQQATTWTCPVCNKAAPYDSLQVDEYVDEILKNTPRDVDQVNIEPNGDWFVPGFNISKKHDQKIDKTTPVHHSPTKRSQSLNGSDDLIVISDESSDAKQPVVKTENDSSDQDASKAILSSISPKSTVKRPAADVIDLTLSDDEEPPPKRPNRQPSQPQSTLQPVTLPTYNPPPSLRGTTTSDSSVSATGPTPLDTAINMFRSHPPQSFPPNPVPTTTSSLPNRSSVDFSNTSVARSTINTNASANTPSAVQTTPASNPHTAASTDTNTPQDSHSASEASASTSRPALNQGTSYRPHSVDTGGSNPVSHKHQENGQNIEPGHAPSHAQSTPANASSQNKENTDLANNGGTPTKC